MLVWLGCNIKRKGEKWINVQYAELLQKAYNVKNAKLSIVMNALRNPFKSLGGMIQ